MDKKKILVVDDEQDSLDFVKAVLEPEGHEVICASNGREGLEKVDLHSPGLIILDVMMPELDGFAVCDKLKSSPKYKSIPVILLTAVAEKMRSSKYPADGIMRARAEEYLEKPIKPDELLKKVTHLLK